MHSRTGHSGVYRSYDLANERQADCGPWERDLLDLGQSVMKRFCVSLSLVLALLSLASGQTGADDQQLLALIKDVQAQQRIIADNQAKIDTKLAEVAEAVRLARIYAKREK
jgi:hypothetical protein